MKAIRTAVIGLALCATTVNVRAAELCALFDDLATLQTAAVQQLLMVSALACNEVASYNGFVVAHQSELQKSDRDLQNFFARLKTQTGSDDYNAFKTRIANTYSLLSAQDKDQYCALTRAALQRSQDRRRSLQEFILTQPALLAIGYQSCGDIVVGGTFSILPPARKVVAPAQAQNAPASRGERTPAQQPNQIQPDFRHLRHYQEHRGPGIWRGSDYFYIGDALRRLYAPYADNWRN